MRPRLVLTIVMVALVAIFTLTNWGIISAPTTINFLITHIEMPLGVVMLMMIGLVILTYLVLLSVAEGSSARAQRRMSREMERLRRLADQSEESRYADLRSYVEGEFAAVNEKLDRIAESARGPASIERATTSLPKPNEHTL